MAAPLTPANLTPAMPNQTGNYTNNVLLTLGSSRKSSVENVLSVTRVYLQNVKNRGPCLHEAYSGFILLLVCCIDVVHILHILLVYSKQKTDVTA